MIPSAFKPESDIEKNKTIYPQGIFLNSDDYEFSIFNRWGEKIFTTNIVNDGWDGTYKDEKSPQDVYTYYVKFSINGDLFEYTGTVTLIR
jgi:gliding motility-associated-like protein